MKNLVSQLPLSPMANPGRFPSPTSSRISAVQLPTRPRPWILPDLRISTRVRPSPASPIRSASVAAHGQFAASSELFSTQRGVADQITMTPGRVLPSPTAPICFPHALFGKSTASSLLGCFGLGAPKRKVIRRIAPPVCCLQRGESDAASSKNMGDKEIPQPTSYLIAKQLSFLEKGNGFHELASDIFELCLNYKQFKPLLLLKIILTIAYLWAGKRTSEYEKSPAFRSEEGTSNVNEHDQKGWEMVKRVMKANANTIAYFVLVAITKYLYANRERLLAELPLAIAMIVTAIKEFVRAAHP